MDDTNNVLNYQGSLDRMEPGPAPVGMEQSLASIAISLKRIADMQSTNLVVYEKMFQAVIGHGDRISQAINNHNSKVIVAERMKP